MPSEDDDLTTLTVTIALDDDDGDHRYGLEEKLLPASTSVLEKSYIIKSPIRPEHACPLPSNNFLIPDLPPNAQKMLCSRLNASAIGSMKNWHYLAALIGIEDDEISRIRQTKDPMMEVLKVVSTVPLSRLITVIGDIGRIDVLISLKPFMHGLSTAKRLARNAPIRNIPKMDERFDSAAATETIANFQFPTKKFIIITYHETEKLNKRNVKMLLLNLQKNADENKYNIAILDIAKCIDETNISQSARNLFKHASQIILFISSKDYITKISNSALTNSSSNNVESANVVVKKLFHCWMDEEYYANACRNFRFRVVLNHTVNNDALPSGWPQTTLHYTFPNNFSNLCEKLFE